jgi:hypothetical protein
MTAAPQAIALSRPNDEENERFSNLAKILEAAAAAGMAVLGEDEGARVPLCRGMDDCSGRGLILDRLRGKKDLPIF